MTEGLYQAKKLIDGAKNILVLTSQNSNIDSLASAVSLSYTLNNKGKIVNLHPHAIPQKYALLFPQTANPNRFVISIKGKEISELYYEKEKQILKIFLSPRGKKITKDDIIFDDFQKLSETEPDLLITIGIDRLERLGDFYEKNFKLFYQTTILNIDNQTTNNKFGNINLISENLPMALISNQLLELLQGQIDQNIKTWILAGIIAFSKDNGFNQEIMDNVLELITPNIQYKELLNLFANNGSAQQLKILEIALKKIEFRRDKRLPSISLMKKDFQESGANARDLIFILKELTSNLLQFPSLLLLWESQDNQTTISGVFYSSKPYSGSKILEAFNGERKGKGIIFKSKNGKINDIKEKIMEIIF
ncbi:hypothetical protein KJ562_00520 [Patescibacteria group bacterium]|nr:hypothetical protein [Patescibacteria group bacterium]MBU4162036.1 hypothetical protein [Patescibacteria group bacterium]